MASNREERKLMRQRGAANRKVKDVDFGLSFGSPKLDEPQESLQQPQSSAPKHSTQSAPQARASPNTHLSLPSAPLSQRSPVRSSPQSPHITTPTSSRNKALGRPSVYDIPLDGDEPIQRSPKRRKLSDARDSNKDGSINHESAQNASQNAQEPRTNGTIDPVPQPPPSNATPDLNQHESPPPRRESPAQEGVSQTESRAEDRVNGDNENTEDLKRQTPAAKNPPRKKKKRKSVVAKIGKSRKSAVNDPRRTSGGSQQSSEQSTPPNNAAGLQAPRLPAEATGSQSRRGRKPAEQNNKKKKATQQQHNSRSAEKASKPGRQPYQKDGQRKTGGQNKGNTTNGEPSAEVRTEKRPETVTDRVNNRAEDESRQEEAEESNLKTSSKSAAGKGKQPKQSGRRQKGVEQNQTDATPTAPESESQTAAATSKKKSKRKSDKSESQQQVSREEQKSRGETVPITVHRLANLSALDGHSHEPSADGEDGRRESSTGQKYKTRGGTNAADVLAQICSETLGKTMTTLDNSISQESNAGRRAEWTRKRKAVEAFSTELENRLFEMSEINESNFVLAAQLKREKKEMEDLRSRLMDVRKERGDIALQIDDVRRRYAEDQQAKMEQDNLNNALYDLQLALDRSYQGKDDDAETDPFAGLEFLLRTVAQGVSSVAADSHGGLLNQVRNFNAQLERTASSLEKKR